MLSAKVQGVTAQLNLAMQLTRSGLIVSTPVIDSLYDLVVDNDGEIYRVQVKSCATKVRNRYRTSIAHGSSNRKKPYKKGSFDFFAIWILPEDTWYFIPLERVRGMQFVSLYPHNEDERYLMYRDAWHTFGA